MADDEKTFRLKYVGTRFTRARLPIDVLSDLPAFRDLLVAFAKVEWREKHPDRKRVPKGFDKSLSFDLVSIEPGSAVPNLVWNRQVAQANLPGFEDELEVVVEESYQDVVALFEEAGSGRYPKVLGGDQIRALDKLGAGLRDGERIEFANATSGNVVYLDAERRKRLITAVRETYVARFEGIGKLVSNSLDGSVTIRTSEHGDILVGVDPEQIVEEFDGSLNQDVQFDLLVELDNQDRFQRVEGVYHIAVIDAEVGAELARCRVRIAEIGSFQPGWNDSHGAAISKSVVEAADAFLVRRPGFSSAYKIFPTEAGGILVDFEFAGWDYSVEFAADGAVEMYGVEIDGPGEMEPVHFGDVGDAFMEEFDSRVGA